jgi:hypothetical protein
MDIKRTDSQRYFEDDEDMDLEMDTKFDQITKIKFIHKGVLESNAW